MEDKIELEIIGLSSSHAQSGSFALVLGEKKGKRRLPIIVGMFEAQSIAVEIEKIYPKRPLTHDLFKSIALEFDLKMNQVLITGLKEGVFFAKIQFEGPDGKIVEVDSRPSDAIALGLRFNTPIYTVEAVLSEAGIILEDSDEAEDFGIEEEVEEEIIADPKSSSGGSDYANLSSEELNQRMMEAIENEDYELAAKIRDELDKRN